MESTIFLPQRDAADPVLVRRCKWCIKRTGAATYWHDGDWIHLPNPIHFFGSANFTDGVCEACANAELAKILTPAV